MKFLSKRVIGMVLAGAMAVGALSGCGGANETASSGDEVGYWVALDTLVSQSVNNFGETPIGKALSEKTGVNVKWIHPAQGQSGEKFNLMVASNDLPDIVEYNWIDYAGGPDAAIEQGLIIDLNDYRDQLPNFFAAIESDEEIEKLVKTDTGKIFGFPMLQKDPSLGSTGGFIIRQDWLDDLGLEKPETIDEWENVLTQFKDKKGATAPLSCPYPFFRSGRLTGAFGINGDYYRDGDTVKFGPYESAFKTYLERMNSWYTKGLLDKNFATIDKATADANMLNGVSGVTFGGLGGGIGMFMQSKPNDTFAVSGLKHITQVKGEKPEYGFTSLPVTWGAVAAVSAKSKNIEQALKLLDFGYSEEGKMLYNFGIEGESYEMVDGYPKYTEKITNNPDGLAMANALALYARANYAGPFEQDRRYLEQYASSEVQQQAWADWADSNATEHNMPFVYVSQEDADEMAQYNTAITTYVDEMVVKFITGQESFDNYDTFVKELESRGIKRVLEIKQAAYDRYKNR